LHFVACHDEEEEEGRRRRRRRREEEEERREEEEEEEGGGRRRRRRRREEERRRKRRRRRRGGGGLCLPLYLCCLPCDAVSLPCANLYFWVVLVLHGCGCSLSTWLLSRMPLLWCAVLWPGYQRRKARPSAVAASSLHMLSLAGLNAVGWMLLWTDLPRKDRMGDI